MSIISHNSSTWTHHGFLHRLTWIKNHLTSTINRNRTYGTNTNLTRITAGNTPCILVTSNISLTSHITIKDFTRITAGNTARSSSRNTRNTNINNKFTLRDSTSSTIFPSNTTNIRWSVGCTLYWELTCRIIWSGFCSWFRYSTKILTGNTTHIFTMNTIDGSMTWGNISIIHTSNTTNCSPLISSNTIDTYIT